MSKNDDIYVAIGKFINTFANYQHIAITPLELSDGIIFAKILLTVHNFHLNTHQLETDSKLWTAKLSNLRRVLSEVQRYYELQHDKGLKTRDIDLVEIARQSQQQEIIKYFELILAVLMESPNKEEYIEKIMSLDQKYQTIFVSIIQNGISSRITTIEEIRAARLLFRIQQSEIENNFLREELEELLNNHHKMEKLIKDLTHQVHTYEDQISKSHIKDALENIRNQQLPIENHQLKTMVLHLKDKITLLTIDHQTQAIRLKEEITNLEGKLLHYQQIEEQIKVYKDQCQQAQYKLKRSQFNDKEKSRLSKLIQEKDATIKKLQERLEELVEKNYSMEENQIYMKMELEKRDVRFKQLQREVRNRLLTANQSLLPPSQKQNLSILTKNRQEYDQVKTQLQRSKIRAKQLERQNKSLSKKAERSVTWEQEKKKMEKMLAEFNQSRNQQIQTLLVAMYQLRQQNIKMHQIITKEVLRTKGD